MFKSLKNHPYLIIFVLDILLIILVVFLAFILKFDGQLPKERLTNFYAFTILAVIITPIIFYIFSLYKISWSFVSLTDIPTIFKGALVSALFLGTILYIFRFSNYFLGFPRSVIFIYAILLFFAVSLLRFAKRIYWQLIRTKTGILKPADEIRLPITSKVLDVRKVKNVLVTGGAGYIGSVLTRQLLDNGFNVKVLDNLLFGDKSIADLKSHPNFQFIEGDILDKELVIKTRCDVDAVVNLAAIVGEPACVSHKDLALKVNYLGTVYLARLCKALGIKRFIHASTCSTYGKQDNSDTVREVDRLSPADFYGEMKIYTEREIMKLMDSNFNPTLLRFSTVYGLSPRMRFDLVVNVLTKKAVKDKEILIFGGDQYRPLVHVKDVSNAIFTVLKSPLSKVGNQIFNVGGQTENYLISEIGDLVKECIPGIEVKTMDNITDKRSYKVDFSKIEKVLGFKNEKTVKDGIIEIRDAINNGQFADLEDKTYYNHLI